MLTGDSRTIAESVSEQIGIDECHAELLPSDKAELLERLKELGGHTPLQVLVGAITGIVVAVLVVLYL